MRNLFFMSMFVLITSCAFNNPSRKISSSDSITVEELKKDINHNFGMSSSFLLTARDNGFKEYVKSLEGSEVDELSEKIIELKKRTREINDLVSDWFDRLSPNQKKEMLNRLMKSR